MSLTNKDNRVMNFLDPRLPDRFWNKVQPCPMSGCWLWAGAGASSKDSYGRTQVDGRNQLAHRAAYIALVGPVPEGLQIDHRCRIRCCVNPAHLEPVTQQENIRRGEAGTVQAGRTHCPLGHAYDETNTRWYQGRRYCRPCHSTYTRDRYRRLHNSAPRVRKLDRIKGRQIRLLIESGHTVSSVARTFNVSRTAVRMVVAGRIGDI